MLKTEKELPLDRVRYLSPHDLGIRLYNTMVMYDGKPYYIDGYDDDFAVDEEGNFEDPDMGLDDLRVFGTIYDASGYGKPFSCNPNSELLDHQAKHVGFLNNQKSCTYCTYLPHRQHRHGIPYHALHYHTLGHEKTMYYNIQHEIMAQALLRVYPSVEDCLKAPVSKAFDTEWAFLPCKSSRYKVLYNAHNVFGLYDTIENHLRVNPTLKPNMYIVNRMKGELNKVVGNSKLKDITYDV